MPEGDPLLVVIAGPNGAGKSTLYELFLSRTSLPFVNADRIATERWGRDAAAHAYDAAAIAEQRRDAAIAAGRSFVAETVLSHPSKLELIRRALAAGYVVDLRLVIVPEALAVARVADRVATGTGHDVPVDKIRSRYPRIWPLAVEAIRAVDTAAVYDNTRADHAHRRVAAFRHGQLVGRPTWPAWTPEALRDAWP
jgi:predicted ABC-type ATPase